jgi:hypothetical protein
MSLWHTGRLSLRLRRRSVHRVEEDPLDSVLKRGGVVITGEHTGEERSTSGENDDRQGIQGSVVGIFADLVGVHGHGSSGEGAPQELTQVGLITERGE